MYSVNTSKEKERRGMTTIRTANIISIVNHNEKPETIGGLNEEEKEFYNDLLREKAEFKAQNGIDLQFTMPTESYNDMW